MRVRLAITVIGLLLLSVLNVSGHFVAAGEKSKQLSRDTLRVKAGMLVILRDSFFVAGRDTLIVPGNEKIRLRKDPYSHSKSFYDSLAVHAGNKRLLYGLYKVFVRDNAPVNTVMKNSCSREDELSVANGKVIRSVRTFNVPLLDGNVRDTAWVARSLVGRLMNAHPQTKSRLILSAFIPVVGETTDGESLADAERLIRSLPGIRDAELYLLNVDHSDSVDLVLVTQDVFPVRASVGLKGTERLSLSLYDRNINGNALELGGSLDQRIQQPQTTDYTLLLRKSNVLNGYGEAQLEMSNKNNRSEQLVSFDRGFLSEDLPDIGGFSVAHVTDDWRADSPSSAYERMSLGGWYGRVLKNKTNWNIIPAFAVDAYSYIDRPELETKDFMLRDRATVLGGLNFIRREFIRTALVSKFGVSEYFPVGAGVQLTGGKEYTREFGRLFFSLAGNWARFQNDAGYFGLSAYGGGFLHAGNTEDMMLRLRFDYFSPLLKVGRVRFRQFANVRYQTIDRMQFLSPFKPEDVRTDSLGGTGTTKQYSVYGLQTIWHMPWMVYGFRFSFINSAELFGLLSGGSHQYLPVLGAGFQLQNDYLTYSAFSFQLMWQPSKYSIPELLSVKFTSLLPPFISGPGIGKPSLPY